MTAPSYHAIRRDEIPEVPFDGGFLRIICGDYKDQRGFQAEHHPLTYYDVHLDEGASITFETEVDDSITAFTLLGSVSIGGMKVPEKTAAKLSEGREVTLTAVDGPAQILYLSSKRLDEPIAWGGPIVMNTTEEMQETFQELRDGTFILDEVDYSDL